MRLPKGVSRQKAQSLNVEATTEKAYKDKKFLKADEADARVCSIDRCIMVITCIALIAWVKTRKALAWRLCNSSPGGMIVLAWIGLSKLWVKRSGLLIGKKKSGGCWGKTVSDFLSYESWIWFVLFQRKQLNLKKPLVEYEKVQLELLYLLCTL